MRPLSFQRWLLVSLFTILVGALPVFAQGESQAGAAAGAQPAGKQEPKKPKGRDERFSPDEAVPGDESKAAKTLSDAERQALRREQQSEAEAAVLPYINNFFETFRFGPEDVLSISVFDKEKYSLPAVTVPPHGVINYPLIGPIKVVGRTSDELQREITEKLSEYIIEPKVTVQLVQAHSLKVMVVGDVGNPGIFEMTRRMTVTEALARAGYITKYGDKSNVHVLRMQASGQTVPMPVNMKEVERGKGQDLFLAPGDTVVVPGNKFKTIDKIMGIVSLGAWMRTIAR